MSVIEQYGVKASPECRAAVIAENAYHPLDPQEGVLYADYELPTYTSEVDIDNIKPLYSEIHEEFGTAYHELVPMDDGTAYKVTRFVAKNPISDVWIVKDTAWGTQPEGLNTDVARKLMSMGFNVMIKGPEINTSIPQSQSAWNTHKVMDAYEKLGYMNAEYFAVEGYSRGAMLAFGTAAYAEQFGRKALYLNLTDPCNALAIKADIETAKKGATIGIDIAFLGGAVVKTLRHPSHGKQLRGTVDLSKEGFKQFVRTGRPLMNGEAGMMAARAPLDMHATIAFFRNCRVNDRKVYQQILEHHDGVRFVRPRGGHGGGIDERIINNAALRFGRLGDQLQEGRRPDEIDYTYITRGLRLLPPLAA